jgi:S-formylglutathione hydrolase
MDVGSGAGFYVNATQTPWSSHYQMFDYVSKELVELVNGSLPVDPQRKSISGHSMGGHGALVVGLRNPSEYRSISAFAPICAASKSAWGQKALAAYLGPDSDTWLDYDAAALIRANPTQHELLIDQGSADPYVDRLRPADLQEACAASGQRLIFKERAGYDHGFYFISTFIEEHLRFHANALT